MAHAVHEVPSVMCQASTGGQSTDAQRHTPHVTWHKRTHSGEAAPYTIASNTTSPRSWVLQHSLHRGAVPWYVR